MFVARLDIPTWFSVALLFYAECRGFRPVLKTEGQWAYHFWITGGFYPLTLSASLGIRDLPALPQQQSKMFRNVFLPLAE
jgi:hypothetical protein